MSRSTTLAAICLGGILVAASTTSAAQTRFDGVYLGTNLGWSVFDVESELKDNGTTIDESDGFAASGFSNGFFLGTGIARNDIYFGFELNVTINDADYSRQSNGFEEEFDVKEGYGITARLGRVVRDQVLFYGLVGYQRTRVEYAASNGFDSFSDKEDMEGVRFGAGAEIASDHNVFARLEYSMTIYSEETFKNGDVEQDLKPNENLVMLSLGYRF